MMLKMWKKSMNNECHFQRHGDDRNVGRGSRRSAWKPLQVALLWARKGGVFKRRLMVELRVVPKFLKTLNHHNSRHQHHHNIHYFERQLSFDKTPIFPTSSSSRSMRFINIPCLNPPLVLDQFDHHQVDVIINNHDESHHHDHHNNYTTDNAAYYDGDSDHYYHHMINGGGRQSFLTTTSPDDDEEQDYEEKVSAAIAKPYYYDEAEEDESVDAKADEFIAKFYRQIKLQRQISYINYTQTLTC